MFHTTTAARCSSHHLIFVINETIRQKNALRLPLQFTCFRNNHTRRSNNKDSSHHPGFSEPHHETKSSSRHGHDHTVWNTSTKIADYAERPITPVTLEHLLKFGEEKDTLNCALYVHRELPFRLARRVKAIQNLPFIVGVNPWIRTVYDLYRESFERIVALPEPNTTEKEKLLTDTLSTLVEQHQIVIPNLAKGFMECGKYMTKEESTRFLDGMIHARIAIRVIAEHFLLLQSPMDKWIGVVNTAVSPGQVISDVCSRAQEICELNYGSAPDYFLTGHTNTYIAYINVHMEYIFMELMKNAMRATVEFSQKMGRLEHPPIEIAIGCSTDDVVLRIRDQGGGIPTRDIAKVWEYSYTTVPKYEDDNDGIFATEARLMMQQGIGGPMAGLGFGLPMSRIYARYFGGSLEFRSVTGHGTDMFVRFPNISRFQQSLEI